MLAQSYDPAKHDPIGWLMSEKLDGVRCFYNHVSRKLYSRNGKPYYPPEEFLDAMPKGVSLDGELWTKRNDF
jgi:DNA ligase-1